MLRHCPKSCNICDFDGNLDDLILMRGDRELLETPYGKTQSLEVDASTLFSTDHLQHIVEEMSSYMESDFYAQSQYASIHYACKNMDRNCAYYKAMGECETNPARMLSLCAPVCQ